MYDITIYKGADYNLTFVAKSVEGNPIDLTGCSVEAMLRPSAHSYDHIDFTVVTNGSGGEIQLKIPAPTTEQLPWSRGVYEVFMTDANDVRKKVLHGKAAIKPAVTKIQDE